MTLQSVQEVGPFVTQLLNLRFILAFDPVITFAIPTFGILAAEENMLKKRPSKQKQCFVR